MRYWSIDIHRTEKFQLEVEAETPQEAMEIAMEMICASDEPTLDFASDTDGFQVMGCR